MSVRREHIIWLIPILVGAATYWRADGMHGIGDRADMAGRSTGGVRGDERQFQSAAELDAEMERVRNEERDQEQLFLDGIASMDVEKLKEELLRLKTGMDDPGWSKARWETSQLTMRLEGMIHQLGMLSGESDLAWVRKNHPEMVSIYVEGWARTKPDEALRYIVRSTQPGICSKETVMGVLDRLGKKDPQALKSAIRMVPWDLFVFENDSPFGGEGYGMEVHIPDADDAEVWWESGAARDLAVEGVRIENLFLIWAEKNPQEALAAWLGWPGQERGEWCGDLFVIVMRSAETEEGYVQLKNDLLKLDPRGLATIRSALGRLPEVSLYSAKMLEGLLETSAPPP